MEKRSQPIIKILITKRTKYPWIITGERALRLLAYLKRISWEQKLVGQYLMLLLLTPHITHIRLGTEKASVDEGSSVFLIVGSLLNFQQPSSTSQFLYSKKY